jgi:hypothetical protein
MSMKSKLRHAVTVSKDSRWWPFYLQRRVMQPTRRATLARQIARLRPAMAPMRPDDDTTAERLQQLQTRGLAPIGRPLDRTQCRELVDYFMEREVHDPHRPALPVFKPLATGRHVNAHIAHHTPEDIVRAPYLLALANDPQVLATVEQFLGCKPSLAYMAAWWSYATPLGPQQAEFFHRDVDDWRFVKLFVYLTDVGAQSGPHVYVTESANSPKLAQIRRFMDDEVAASFEPHQVLTMTGQAGDAFLEDTFGIHKGQPVVQGHRLIFQAVYSMHALPYGPMHPVIDLKEVQAANPSRRFDPWINRFYLRD